MIVKIHRAGRSFKGVGRYLSHDAKADTKERVAWTHTLNLAHSDVPSAIDEMLWTYRSADLLKRQAGIATGGTRLEKPVKHVSLSWHESEHPTPEHMIETVQAYMDHMGWSDRQAILFAHRDTRHPHVHVMVNAVSPEDGRAMRTAFEWRRSQVFALGYEREAGLIFCEERLKPVGERDPSPTRDMWQKLKAAAREHERPDAEQPEPEYFTRGGKADGREKEWIVLKALQRDQRDAFREANKQERREARNAIYKTVRQEFRPDWRSFYEAAKAGNDKEDLAEIKASIVKRQNEALEKRCKEEFEFLREYRGGYYARLLDHQKQDRALLRERQAMGVRSFDLLDSVYPSDRQTREADRVFATNAAVATQLRRTPWMQREDMRETFRKTAPEICTPPKEPAQERRRPDHAQFRPEPKKETVKVRGGLDAAGGIGLGALGALASIGERLFDGFLGGGETSQPPPPPARAQKESVEPEQIILDEGKQVANEGQASEARALQEFWEQRRRHRRRERD